MNEIRPVFSSRIQFFGKSKERFGIVMEKVYVKDGFWVGDSVLLEVVIETSTRRPEVWDAAGGTDACPGHHHNVLKHLILYCCSDILQGLHFCLIIISSNCKDPSPFFDSIVADSPRAVGRLGLEFIHRTTL